MVSLTRICLNNLQTCLFFEFQNIGELVLNILFTAVWWGGGEAEVGWLVWVFLFCFLTSRQKFIRSEKNSRQTVFTEKGTLESEGPLLHLDELNLLN